MYNKINVMWLYTYSYIFLRMQNATKINYIVRKQLHIATKHNMLNYQAYYAKAYLSYGLTTIHNVPFFAAYHM